jgi:hypothetical protein
MYTIHIINVLTKYLSLVKGSLIFSARREPSQQDVSTHCYNLLAELHRYPTANPQLMLLQTRIRALAQHPDLGVADLRQKLVEELELALCMLK